MEACVTRVDKLITKLQRKPAEAAFSDIERLLNAHGWVVERWSGSNAIFVPEDDPGHVGLRVVTLKGRKVARAYIQRVLEHLDLDQKGGG